MKFVGNKAYLYVMQFFMLKHVARTYRRLLHQLPTDAPSHGDEEFTANLCMSKQQLCRTAVNIVTTAHDCQLVCAGHVAPHRHVIPVQYDSPVPHLPDNRVDRGHKGGPLAQHKHAVGCYVIVLHEPQVLHCVRSDVRRQCEVT